MPNQLIKFINQTDGGDRGKVYWGRADKDGLPFRGEKPPLMREEEFQDRLVKVADPKNATFYTGNQEDNDKYLSVMDGVSNGWFHLVFIERWREDKDKHHHIYMEWLEYYLEDGKPARAMSFGGGQ